MKSISSVRLGAVRQKGFSVPILVALFFLGLLFVFPVSAQEEITDDQVNDVAKEVYCPVCENTPLDVCETQACADWRELIRTRLGQGQTKEQIFDYFATQYGDRVLARPPREGFNLILWFWPVIALVVGAIFFGRYMQHLRESAEPAAASSATAEDAPKAHRESKTDYVARIEEELAERS